jgi:hypothetical protein
MMQSEMKLVNESNEKALDKPIMKAAKPERRRASEPMPGIAKIGCRLKCEVRGQKAARGNMLTQTGNSEDEILQ